MFFEDSSPKRKKAALKAGTTLARQLVNSPIPPAKTYELFTPEELMSGGDRTLIYDVESYKNYWLVSFKCTRTGKVVYFEDSPSGQLIINGEPIVDPMQFCFLLNFILNRFLIVGFNCRSYDLPMVLVALQGVRAWKLNDISQEIIQGGMLAHEVEKKYGVRSTSVNQIDLIEVAPIEASLKLYAGRLHCQRMQDLPFNIHAELTVEQAAIVRDYNINDLDNTELLFNELATSIVLREELGKEYDLDLRSKSDAQIAEAVIGIELEKIGSKATKPTIEPGWTFNYQVPDCLEYKTPQLQKVLEVVRNATFVVGDGGKAMCPDEIKALKIPLGNCVYRMGNGGLHSSEQSVSYFADETQLLRDVDVESFYPWLILTQGLYPQHLGPAFLKVFESIVNRRIHAKRTGNKKTSDSLKITINGTFGKLGNRYSAMYAPDLMSQVTISGQLYLLMLIEMLELAGFSIVSANTDGIVILCPPERAEEMETIVIVWEEKTGLRTEETRYKSIHFRDVNNYIAVKYKQDKETKAWLDEVEGCKMKGIYAEVGSALNSPLSKNPESYICSMAVQAMLLDQTPIAETIGNFGANAPQTHYPTPMSRFVSVRTVKGGAQKDGVYLGRAIRWYYAKGETGEINYVLSGNKVANSEGAKPLMIMPEDIPEDLDYDHYYNEAVDMLYDIGYYQRAKVGKLI